MEAMEHCGGPFIFSIANPHAASRTICNIRMSNQAAPPPGRIGINGVGRLSSGDIDASTGAIFRCLDYVVQLIAPSAGLGFDYTRISIESRSGAGSATMCDAAGQQV